AVRRGVARGRMDSTSLDIRKSSADDELNELVPKDALATFYGIDQFVELLNSFAESREEIQLSRVTPEHVISRLFLETNAASFSGAHFSKGYQQIVEAFDVVDPPDRTRVLIITG